MARIIVCGGNGAGKSTLGKALARELKWRFMDIEDYYFPTDDGDYKYASARSEAEVTELLEKDLEENRNLVFSAVKGNYGRAAEMLDCAVYINVPKELRLERVRNRSYQKFGNRIQPGGDLYEKEQKFFDMVENRSDDMTSTWLKTLNIPVIEIDGRQPTENCVVEVKKRLAALNLL